MIWIDLSKLLDRDKLSPVLTDDKEGVISKAVMKPHLKVSAARGARCKPWGEGRAPAGAFPTPSPHSTVEEEGRISHDLFLRSEVGIPFPAPPTVPFPQNSTPLTFLRIRGLQVLEVGMLGPSWGQWAWGDGSPLCPPPWEASREGLWEGHCLSVCVWGRTKGPWKLGEPSVVCSVGDQPFLSVSTCQNGGVCRGDPHLC